MTFSYSQLQVHLKATFYKSLLPMKCFELLIPISSSIIHSRTNWDEMFWQFLTHLPIAPLPRRPICYQICLIKDSSTAIHLQNYLHRKQISLLLLQAGSVQRPEFKKLLNHRLMVKCILLDRWNCDLNESFMAQPFQHLALLFLVDDQIWKWAHLAGDRVSHHWQSDTWSWHSICYLRIGSIKSVLFIWKD